ncbi:hypothetical protein EVAR_93789_1 [Eumeta japonica]|uniref:Uncharacterized protein n=1 Tax=Eumeta variegata TaxID=151549 RepID=A0A4C1VBD6_EUMVA|nr:hypothetical protein EVAR_93789_1 [Eumeta japonica]
MTVRGRLQRSPMVKMEAESVRFLSNVTELGLMIDERLSFVQHAITIGKRASKSFVSTAALPVLAGVMPADLEVICAGKTQRQHKT